MSQLDGAEGDSGSEQNQWEFAIRMSCCAGAHVFSAEEMIG